jgi:hypothetical protein
MCLIRHVSLLLSHAELEGVQTPLRLLLTALLCNMLTSMMPQLNEELRLLELPNAEGNREFQVRCLWLALLHGGLFCIAPLLLSLTQ